jgi:N-acyl-D-amino-acid deacylase
MILIRDAHVIDGTGEIPRKADVLVNGDRIAAIGSFRNHRADTIIEGYGGYVTPGFIDVNSASDHYLTLFTNPDQQDFLLQGVTTIIGGNCGASLAPLLYGTLESIRTWADTNLINVGWHTIREFFGVLEQQGIGVNFGTLIGHTTIRRALIGDTLRDLTMRELDVFKKIVASAIREGALGFSTGLGHAHGTAVPYSEIKILAETVKEEGGVYATHLRNERKGIVKAVKEAIKIANDIRIPVLISHFRPIRGFEREFDEALSIIRDAPQELSLHFDSDPSDMSLFTIYSFLPDWARRGNLEEMRGYLRVPHIRERIVKELPMSDGQDVVIVQAPGAPYLAGETLHAFAEHRGLGTRAALLALMELTKLRAVVLYRNINIDAAIQSLCEERAFVASHAPSFRAGMHALRHEQIASVFTKFLRIADSTKLLSIEKIIQKFTSAPAKKFSLESRGELREGYFADIALIKGDRVTDVLVNGEIVIENGSVKETRAGKIIRKL